MEPDIDFVRCLDQLIRQARTATGAEHDIVYPKSGEDVIVPPAAMPEFHDIAPGRIKLSSNAVQPRATEMKARWQLKEKAAHVRTEEVGDMAEVADEFLRSGEMFDVSDQLGNFDRIDKFPSAHLPPPPAYRRRSGPGIKRSVEFHRPEMIRIMSEPTGGGQVSIKLTTPMPIKPSGTTDIHSWQIEAGCSQGGAVGILLRLQPRGMHSRSAINIFAALFGTACFAAGAPLFSPGDPSFRLIIGRHV